MKSLRLASLLAALCLPFCLMAQSDDHTGQNLETGARQLLQSYGNLPLSFEPNVGQADPQVEFLAHGPGYVLSLGASDAVLHLATNGETDMARRSSTIHTTSRIESLRLHLIGSNPVPQISGQKVLPGKSNYLRGNDQRNWHTKIPNYAQVKYSRVYPGVDLLYHGEQGSMEYDFIVAPQATAAAINYRIEGVKRMEIAANGDLLLGLERGDVRLQKPRAFQSKDSVRHEVAVGFTLLAKDGVGFLVGRYDHSRPLVIDPVLSYSRMFTGVNSSGIAVDSFGNAYITGSTCAGCLTTTSNAFQKTGGSDFDAFVTKFNATGTALIYSTYLGGSAFDIASGIKVDTTGHAYVIGTTQSSNFPVTPSAFQSNFHGSGGGNDAFITKLSSDGSSLAYSTYLGGTGNENGNAIAIDSSGNAYVTGSTESTNFPVTPNAFQRQCKVGSAGTCAVVFITKLNPTGSALVYSTLLGDFGDTGFGIALDAFGDAYVTGVTQSANFPLTPDAAQRTIPAFRADAFVTKLKSTGSALAYSTYLGGSDGTRGAAIAVDGSSGFYVTGSTFQGFPVTSGAFQKTFGGCCNTGNASGDAFVTKFNSNHTIAYSTYLGGGGDDAGVGIAVDASGVAYVTGITASQNFPVTSNAVQKTNVVTATCGTPGFSACFDTFDTTLNASGSGIAYYSTYLGSPAGGNASGIAIDPKLNAYVTGSSGPGFPVTTGTNTQSATFVAKLVIEADLVASKTASANPVGHGSNLTYNMSVFNKGPDGADGAVLTDTLPGGTTFVSASTTNGTCTTATVGTTVTLTCKRANRLLPGHSWGPITLTVHVNAPSGTTLTNHAHASANTQDFVQSNNTATVSVKVQ